MATRSPEVEEARAALARARTERQRAKALEDYNRAMGREPRRSEMEENDYDYRKRLAYTGRLHPRPRCPGRRLW